MTYSKGKVYLDYYSIVHEVNSYAHLNGVTIVFDDSEEFKAPSAHMTNTGHKTIKLSRPRAEWSDEDILRWRGDFYHEMGHFAPEVLDDYQLAYDKNIGDKSPTHMMLNILGDHKQEKNNLGMYSGRDSTLSRSYALDINDVIKQGSKVKEALEKVQPDSPDAILASLMWLTTEARGDWQSDVSGAGEAFYEQCLPDSIKKVADKFKEKGYIEELNTIDAAEKMYDFLMRIYKEDFGKSEEEVQQMAQGGNMPQDGEGGEPQQGEGGGEDKASGEEGDAGAGSEGGEGESTSKRTQEATINWKDLVPHKHDVDDSDSTMTTPMHIDFDGWQPKMDYNGFDLRDNLRITDYAKKKHLDSNYYASKVQAHKNNGLANKVRKLLLVHKQSLTIHSQKKGKISNRNVHRVITGATQARKQAVFKKNIHKHDIDTAVTVLIDYSGSMGGSKMTSAIECGLMLNHAISAAGVPVELLGFSDKSHLDSTFGSDIGIFKKHKERVNDEKLQARMVDMTNIMYNNADGEAILYAYNRLRKQPNRRKLLIVLSDGSPATSRYNIYEFTHKVIKTIEKSKEVEIYGIGIEDYNVEHFYTNNTVINDSSQLEEAVIKVIKNKVINQ